MLKIWKFAWENTTRAVVEGYLLIINVMHMHMPDSRATSFQQLQTSTWFKQKFSQPLSLSLLPIVKTFPALRLTHKNVILIRSWSWSSVMCIVKTILLAFIFDRFLSPMPVTSSSTPPKLDEKSRVVWVCEPFTICIWCWIRRKIYSIMHGRSSLSVDEFE